MIRLQGWNRRKIMKTADEHGLRDHGYEPRLDDTWIKAENKTNILRDLNSIIFLLSFEEFKIVLTYAMSLL